MPDLFIFDDAQARRWEPFSLTRPIGTLLHGCLTLPERGERLWGTPFAGYLSSEDLIGFGEDGRAGVVTSGSAPAGADRVFLSSRAIPTGPAKLPPVRGDTRPLTMAGEVVGWIVAAGSEGPTSGAVLDPDSAPGPGQPIPLEGTVLDWPWRLVEQNGRRISSDISWLFPHDSGALSSGVDRLGTETVSIDESVRIEPGVLLDAREGPIRLDSGVRVQAGSRVVGPAFVGRGSTVLGGPLEDVSIGPVCKVRGEVEASVILGFANKAHDGFLGHALVGRWVNLGALTTNSDLKNTYGPVRVRLGSGTVDTGLAKVGVFLGDHVKTGIGTLLPTGGIVGAGTSVFTGGLAPPHLPAFSWVTADGIETFRLDRFLEIAETVMTRRGEALEEGMRAVFRRAWDRTAGDAAGF